MKKHLVLLCGVVYPNPSPTGKAALRYVSLLEDEYDISVIGIGKFKKNESHITDGKQAYLIISPRLNAEEFFIDIYKKSKNVFSKFILKLLINFFKGIGKLESMFIFPNNLFWYEKKAYKMLEKINTEKNIDAIFTVSSPVTAHATGKRYKDKHPEIVWTTYTVDSFAAQCRSTKKYERAKKYETRLLQNADFSLLSKEIWDNSEFLYKGFENKFAVLNYLMPKRYISITESNIFDSNKINLLYSGRFYRKIRNPEFLLKIIEEAGNDIVLHLYEWSDCEEIIDEYIKRNTNIIRHEPVFNDKMPEIMESADILVNVGNTLKEFIPSKTYEYIAVGKPIVHIYQSDYEDEILKNYPIILQISSKDNIENSTKKLREFCRENCKKRINEKDISNIYKNNSKIVIRNILTTSLENR